MSNALAPISSDALHAKMEYAKAMAASNLLPKAYERQPANILVAIEYGEALGLAPMVALQQISVIQGKPTMSAQLMASLVRQAGHRLRISVDESTKAAVAELTRSDDPDFTFRAAWTMERANAAGLVGKGGSWKTYPLAMLKARAITEVCRDGCPEVLAGVAYTPEELEPTGGPGRVSVAHLVPDAQPVTTEVADPDTGEIIPVEDTVDALHRLDSEVSEDEVLR